MTVTNRQLENRLITKINWAFLRLPLPPSSLADHHILCVWKEEVGWGGCHTRKPIRKMLKNGGPTGEFVAEKVSGRIDPGA